MRGNGDAAGRDGHPLTPRELEVARHVAAGLDNAEIAKRLSLSRATVASHIAKILRKLGSTSRVQIAVWFTEQRLSGRAP